MLYFQFEDGHLKTPPEYYGLIPRSFHYLFKLMKQQPRSGFRITTSYLEIYNEQVISNKLSVKIYIF